MEDHLNGNGNGNAQMGTDAISIVTLVLSQMTMLEARLVRKLDENAEAAKDRWTSHDAQHDEWEKALKAIGHRLDDHLRKEEHDALVLDARIDPLRRAGYWLAREWRTVAIIALIVADIAHRLLEEGLRLFP